MDNILHLIGLCKRAGALEVGDEPVGAACRARTCRLLLLAEDAADNTVRRARHFAQAGACPELSIPYDKEQLGAAVGRTVCAMAAVTEIGFAGAIAGKLAELDAEKDGAAAEKLAAKAEKAAQRRREQRSHEKNLRRGGKAKKPYIPTRVKRARQSK